MNYLTFHLLSSFFFFLLPWLTSTKWTKKCKQLIPKSTGLSLNLPFPPLPPQMIQFYINTEKAVDLGFYSCCCNFRQPYWSQGCILRRECRWSRQQESFSWCRRKREWYLIRKNVLLLNQCKKEGVLRNPFYSHTGTDWVWQFVKVLYLKFHYICLPYNELSQLFIWVRIVLQWAKLSWQRLPFWRQ